LVLANPCVVKNEAIVGGITVGGQPSAEELTSGRFSTVINIRGNDEDGNDTVAILAGTDVTYASVPWTIDVVTKADIEKIRQAVDNADGAVLIH
jgi:protein tyrosine phosphatase (PTP) superfamily phosphohydrolase (DUF442 family)